MNRRDILRLGAIGAAPVALPGQHRHPEPPAKSPETPGKAGSPLETGITKPVQPGWKPSLFDEHENQTVVALVNLIIPATDTPGAKEALVNRHIDHILHDGPEERQVEFREGLWWLDGYANRKYRKAFVGCSPAQQQSILEILETGKEPDVARGHRFFLLAKSLTARLYYATQIGFQELNKSGRVPDSFGCKHPEHA